MLAAGSKTAFLSSTELAVLAGVSQPSVTRFARALGFDGYQDLRRHVQELAGAGRQESAPDVLRNELQAAIKDEISNLEVLSTSLEDPTWLYELGAEMAKSAPLIVLGVRASAALAHHFGYFARRALGSVEVITQLDSSGEDQLHHAMQAGATWMLCIALPRYPKETLHGARMARARGVKVATITDSRLGPFSEHSDRILTVGVGSRLIFDSYSAAIVLCNALLGALCDADSRKAQERLDAFERSALERQIFVS